jgi:hypothetical protein
MNFKPTFEEVYSNEMRTIKRIKSHLRNLKADTIKEMY